MTAPLTTFVLILFGLVLALALVVVWLARRLWALSRSKRSLSAKYGRLTEQFLPFAAHYPYDPEHFRFIGTPVDGIQFEDDKIIFVEFKVGEARLTSNQEHIKHLVHRGRVKFEEIRME